MPNWVFNNLKVTGSAYDIGRLQEQLNKPVRTEFPKWSAGGLVPDTQYDPNPVFSFYNIISPDDWDAYYTEGQLEPLEGETSAETIYRGFATGNGWYNWNVRNWGCKWDVSDVDTNFDGLEGLFYSFSTPWAPPLPAMKKLAAQYPTLRLEFEYEEETGWGGAVHWENGVCVGATDYNEPSCHADYENRDRDCPCDGSEPIYDDCPSV